MAESSEKAVAAPPKPEMTPEEAKKKALQDRRALFAQVLGTGLVASQMKLGMEVRPDGMLKLPNGRLGEWIRPAQAGALAMIGYRVETEMPKGMHDSGDSTTKIGDLILASVSPEDYELIRAYKREQAKRLDGYDVSGDEDAAPETADPEVPVRRNRKLRSRVRRVVKRADPSEVVQER